MKYVKWFFVVLLIGSLTSFVGINGPSKGLNVGDMAPDFSIRTMSSEKPGLDLKDMKGRYVLISFWASYDGPSRMRNACLSNVLRMAALKNVELVSVSFDDYKSVFEETVRKDRIVTPTCFAETQGKESDIFRKYDLSRGFTNYLLDERGVIIAKDIAASDLLSYLN